MIFSGKFSIPIIDTCIAASEFLISKELPSIRLNHPSIPVEGFLPRPLSGSTSVLLFVYIDESIPFFISPVPALIRSMGAQEVYPIRSTPSSSGSSKAPRPFSTMNSGFW